MHRSSLAPELSATLRRVSCWIILLLSLLDNLKYAPAFLLGDGAGFGDANQVADATLVLLVVDLELGALPDCLLVEPVCFGRADLDDDRLVHLVRDHGAQPDFPLAALGGLDAGRSLGRGQDAHEPFSTLALGSGAPTAIASGATWATMPKARSWSTVMMRA